MVLSGRYMTGNRARTPGRVARKNGTPAQAAARAGLGFATRPSDALDVERARETGGARDPTESAPEDIVAGLHGGRARCGALRRVRLYSAVPLRSHLHM